MNEAKYSKIVISDEVLRITLRQDITFGMMDDEKNNPNKKKI